MKFITLMMFLAISTAVLGQSKVTVNADKTVSVNGSKFFPISVYVQSDWAGIVNMGVNAASRPFCVNANAFAQSENNKLYCHYTAGSGCDAENAQDIRNRRTSAFVNSVNQTKNSNYLFGYGLPDEPISAMNLSAADTKWAYDVIKSADPNHPVFLTEYARDISAYKNSADIFLNDLYPFNNLSNPLYEIKTRFVNMQNQVAPKPAWLIIQTGSQFGTPTNAQIRAETYLSIALGSTGVILYSYDVTDAGGVHNIKVDGDPTFMKNLVSELKSFSPYFLGSTNSNLVYSSNDVDALLKDYEGKSYLIAVNKSTSVKNISFSLAGRGNATATIKGLSAAGSIRTGQTLTLSSAGVFSDNLQGLEAVVYEIKNETISLRIPENPAHAVAGLDYKYYHGSWNVLPDFSSLTPIKSGTTSSPDLSQRNRDDQFGFSYTGYVNIPADGSYTFYTSSDDGSQLYIGPTLVVNNDGLHGTQEASGSIGLKAGKHAFRTVFFEQGGGQVLSVSYAGPTLTKQVIPSSVYYRVSSTVPNVAPSVSLTAPANNTSYTAPASIILSANASDADGAVSKVDFYNGNSLIFTDATAPYSFTWTSLSPGTYTISVKATDNMGASTNSSSLTVTVKQASTNACSGTAAYVENGNYTAGSKVQNEGIRYECKSWPYSGWCNGAAWAYQPGSGAYWTDAWTLLGSCTGNAASSKLSGMESEAVLTNAPNPFYGTTTIEVIVVQQGNVSLKVYDKNGKEVAVLAQGYLSSGTHRFEWNSHQLAPDVYVIRYQNNDQLITRKMVKTQ